MSFRSLRALIFLGLPLRLACGSAPRGSGEAGNRRCSAAVLENKVRGGWAGQMIGVSFGAPTEFSPARR